MLKLEGARRLLEVAESLEALAARAGDRLRVDCEIRGELAEEGMLLIDAGVREAVRVEMGYAFRVRDDTARVSMGVLRVDRDAGTGEVWIQGHSHRVGGRWSPENLTVPLKYLNLQKFISWIEGRQQDGETLNLSQ